MTRKQVVALVGGGLAAVCAANELRDAGLDGKIVLFSSEQHPPYDRPPLSKAVLTGGLTVEDCLLRPWSWYDECDIDVVPGVHVDVLDAEQRQLRLGTGEAVRFDHALLATGAKARWPESLGSASDRVFALRTLADSLAIRSSLVSGASVAIIGGGFIGVELASSAISLSSDHFRGRGDSVSGGARRDGRSHARNLLRRPRRPIADRRAYPRHHRLRARSAHNRRRRSSLESRWVHVVIAERRAVDASVLADEQATLSAAVEALSAVATGS